MNKEKQGEKISAEKSTNESLPVCINPSHSKSIKLWNIVIWEMCTLVPPYTQGIMFQDPQFQQPETTASTKPYIYYVYSYPYILMVKFNL